MSPDISESTFEEASTLRVVPRVGLGGNAAWQPVRVPRRDVVLVEPACSVRKQARFQREPAAA